VKALRQWLGVELDEVSWRDKLVAAACAVGAAIGFMHVTKAIHPPGGATALSAVIAGPAVHALGYGFVLRPVALNALVIVTVAIAYNWWFPWRRYPAHLVRRRAPASSPTPPVDERGELTHDDIRHALRSLDSFVDVTEDDLVRLHRLFTHRPPDRPAGHG